ncbi:MAG: helix-turn-helix domain-containing protein [archaeon]
MNTKILQEIGLNSSEARVYLALLDLGDSTRKAIVHDSGIAGSKVYDLLNKLQEKGLVSVYIKDKVKHFKPTNPKQILSYLETKRHEIVQVEEQAKLFIPLLLEKFNSSKEDQEVELLSGMKGLEIIFREQVETLKKGEMCYVIGGTWGNETEMEQRVQTFFEKVHVMRQEKGIRTKMLFNGSQRLSTEKLYSRKRFRGTETKYIEHASPVAINIYNDKTIIIIFGKKVSSIYIHSQDVANSFIEYFDLLWKQAKS